MVISIGILAVMMSLAGLAMTRSAEAYQATTRRSMLEVNTRRALDRVIDELVTASAGSIVTPLAPDWPSAEIEFQQVANIVGGLVVLGTPTIIRFDPDDGTLALIRNAGLANEVRAIILRNVPRLLEGETPNGSDDNGNGLIDEGGFAVTREGSTLIVRLSARQTDGQGQLSFCTVETSIALRN